MTCRLVEMGLEGKVIRLQDLSTLIIMVARNPRGQNLAWNFVKKNWNTLVQKLVQLIGQQNLFHQKSQSLTAFSSLTK